MWENPQLVATWFGLHLSIYPIALAGLVEEHNLKKVHISHHLVFRYAPTGLVPRRASTGCSLNRDIEVWILVGILYHPTMITSSFWFVFYFMSSWTTLNALRRALDYSESTSGYLMLLHPVAAHTSILILYFWSVLISALNGWQWQSTRANSYGMSDEAVNGTLQHPNLNNSSSFIFCHVAHRYRRLFLVFSRYTYINTLTRAR